MPLLLRPRTIVRVTEFGSGGDSFIARIVGTDLFHSKYQVGRRYCGWNEYRYSSLGTWAFPREVEPLATADVPFVAALCSYDGVPIILYPEGIEDVRPGWEHVDSYWMFPENSPAYQRGKRMFRRHKTRPEANTAADADVWDCDTAFARGYQPSTDDAPWGLA